MAGVQNRRPMNVLVSHSQAAVISGAEWAILDMLRCRSSGFEYRMQVPGRGALAEFYRRQGVAVWAHGMETPRRRYPGLHWVQSLFLARRMRAAGVQLCVANTFPALTRVSTACRMARVPLAGYVREYVRDTPHHRTILSRANEIWAVSADLAGHLGSLCQQARIAVVHDHLDLLGLLRRVNSHRESGRRVLPFDARHPIVGLIGRLTPYKQQDLFLRAIPRIQHEVPEARFAIVGGASPGDRAFEESLLSLSKALELEPYLVMTGYRPEAIEMMAECRVICVPSIREPYPRVVFEAQSAGVPVIAANTGGCPEMIEHRVSGVLFDVKAVDAEQKLADAVVEVLRDRSWGETLAAGGKMSVAERFRNEAPVRHFEKLMTRLQGVEVGG